MEYFENQAKTYVNSQRSVIFFNLILFKTLSEAMKSVVALLVLCCSFSIIFGQCPGWTNFQTETDTFYNNPVWGITVSARLDRMGRDFVYVGAKSAGLKVFDISQANPVQVANIPRNQMGNIDAVNLDQVGNYLYISLGDLWNDSPGQRQLSGLAIADVTDPSNPILTDYYTYPGDSQGSAVVVVRDSLAYIGAMENGLIILNVANPSDIQLESRLELADSFPHIQYPLSDTFYNARGLAVADQYAFVCYDRGGLRVVDITDPANPMQVSQYVDSSLIDFACAYNSIAIYDTLAFVALDYYGIEILNISDPLNITQLAYWRPGTWPNATNNPFAWANSDGHANEIAYDPICKRLYFNAGKTDLVSLSVANPSNPDSCDTFGDFSDTYSTWGMDFYDGKVTLSYVWAPWVPLQSYWNGFRVIAPPACTATEIEEEVTQNFILLYPNPSTGQFTVRLPDIASTLTIEIADLHGRTVWQENRRGVREALLNPDLARGNYMIVLTVDGNRFFKKIIRQ
jgi:hypothetical protein